jgi:hypothetical protein
MNLIKNVGKQDRNIRFAVGGLAILLGIFTGFWLLDIIGLILVVTAYLGTCVAYIPLKIDTTKGGTDG